MRKSSKPAQDGWGPSGPRINAPENLEAIRRVLEVEGPVIVEWKHYRGGRSPDWLAFDDFEEFEKWLDSTAEGDSIWVWNFAAVCTTSNAMVHGKSPDDRGWVPEGGAY